MKLTQARLKELLHYDPETGIFTWLTTIANGVQKGTIAGYVNRNDGYKRIGVDGKEYKVSRLAWLFVEGYFPENEVDHRNRIKHDDRWENLRHVSRQCNMRNCSIAKNNKSGITGVHWFKKLQKWQAHITISGKTFHLGLFKNKLDAARARWNAEIKYGFPNCNTTSSAYLYLRGEYAT